jgi:proteasome lid subunit RPN8/RPN11
VSADFSRIQIPRAVIDDMIAHAREMDPFECCGLLAGRNGKVSHQYRISNTVARSGQALELFKQANVKRLEQLSEKTRPMVAYFMDTRELMAAFKDMRQKQLDLLVVYHSHTESPAYPSETDIGLAMYPEAAYLIVSLEDKRKPDLQAYWIKDRQVTPADFQPVP